MSAVLNACVAVSPVPEAPGIGPLLSYHCHANGPVPPVTVEDSVTACPLSMIAEEGWTETEGAVVVTTPVANDVVVEGVGEELSVTTTQ